MANKLQQIKNKVLRTATPPSIEEADWLFSELERARGALERAGRMWAEESEYYKDAPGLQQNRLQWSARFDREALGDWSDSK